MALRERRERETKKRVEEGGHGSKKVWSKGDSKKKEGGGREKAMRK